MALHWKDLPTEPPTTEALSILRQAWRGESVDPEEGIIVAANVLGFGAHMAVHRGGPHPTPAFAPSAGPPPSQDQVEAAFAQVIEHKDKSFAANAAAAPAGAFPWAILVPIAFDLLRKWLKF
jgi:hypothetical protein